MRWRRTRPHVPTGGDEARQIRMGPQKPPGLSAMALRAILVELKEDAA